MQSEPDQSTRFPESVVQDIWARQLFERGDLRTTDGELVRVVNPGRKNDDAGPDFLAAQIVIGSLRWFGDVEIHTSSGIWNEHKHEQDARYNNVILHVSLLNDFWSGRLKRKDGTILPEVILSSHLTKSITALVYELAKAADQSIPCSAVLNGVSPEIVQLWIRRLARVRIEKRMAAHAHGSIRARRRHLLRMIFRALGYSKNSDAMERLFDISSPYLDKVDTSELPALLLGIAGLLPSSKDLTSKPEKIRVHEYQILNTFAGLSQRYSLTPMRRVEWNYFRLRPASFPDVRVAQAAEIMSRSRMDAKWLTYPAIRQLLLSRSSLTKLRRQFSAPPVTAGVPLTTKSTPGQSRIDRIIINAIAPYVLVESVLARDEDVATEMLKALSILPAEVDTVTKMFDNLGIESTDAYFSQGLHELSREYCSKVRCLACDIGRNLIHAPDPNTTNP